MNPLSFNIRFRTYSIFSGSLNVRFDHLDEKCSSEILFVCLNCGLKTEKWMDESD